MRREVRADEAGRSLVDVLGAWLAAALGRPVSRARVRAMVRAGAVRVGGELVRGPGRPLRAGESMEADVDEARLVSPVLRTDRPFVLTPRRILYRDAALLAVDKPAGLPTHETADPARPSLVCHVKRFLPGPAAGPEHLAVHQRLDRDTSGVVLFVLDPRANPGLSRQFAEHRVRKTYLALTARPARLPEATFRVAAPLGIEGRPAETTFRILERHPLGLLVEAQPLTGRKHQIRRHLAVAGLPILGDDHHAPPDIRRRAPRLMLHAARLELRHPLTGAPLVIESPLPQDFRRGLARLRVAQDASNRQGPTRVAERRARRRAVRNVSRGHSRAPKRSR